MLVKDILRVKGEQVYTVTPKATLHEAACELVKHNVGSLVVCEDDKVVGIITERDLLRTVAEEKPDLDQLTVSERMSTQLTTCPPEEDVDKVMGLMTEKRIRHLPILKEGKLAGMISIGDVVKAQQVRTTMENQQLMNYIQS